MNRGAAMMEVRIILEHLRREQVHLEYALVDLMAGDTQWVAHWVNDAVGDYGRQRQHLSNVTKYTNEPSHRPPTHVGQRWEPPLGSDREGH
jgi:hypothetical protein